MIVFNPTFPANAGTQIQPERFACSRLSILPAGPTPMGSIWAPAFAGEVAFPEGARLLCPRVGTSAIRQLGSKAGLTSFIYGAHSTSGSNLVCPATHDTDRNPIADQHAPSGPLACQGIVLQSK